MEGGAPISAGVELALHTLPLQVCFLLQFGLTHFSGLTDDSLWATHTCCSTGTLPVDFCELVGADVGAGVTGLAAPGFLGLATCGSLYLPGLLLISGSMVIAGRDTFVS